MGDRREPDLPRPAGGPAPDLRATLARRRLAGDQSTPEAPTAKPVQVSGTVEQAVEGSQLVLRDQLSGVWFTLVGGDPAVVRLGLAITVRGVPTGPDSSARQQGTPLRIVSAWTEPPGAPPTGRC